MSCYYAGSDRPRMVRGEHLEAGCKGGNCKGCVECTEPHCLVQWHGERGNCKTHAATVCVPCVSKAREHLANVVRMSGLPLLEQVMSSGDTEAEAADLLGPAANPKQWRQRSDYGHIYEADARAGWHTHPLSVLGWYDMLVTEHLGHSRSTKITIVRAANYLDRNLTWLAADVEFDFADLANALADLCAHLELVLHDGEQVETGAPCMKCRRPLRRVFAGNELPWSHRDGSRPRTNVDVWACGRCQQWRSEGEYRLNVAEVHRVNAEWLTDQEMEIRTGIKAGTVREWSRERDDRPALVDKRRDSGRMVYLAADVERIAREKGMIAS